YVCLALLLGALYGSFLRGRMTPRAGHRVAEEEHGFAAHVSADEVRVASKSGVDHLELEPRSGRPDAVVGGLRSVQREGLRATRGREIPRLREPLRRQFDRILMHVGETDLPELVHEPFGALVIGRRTD